MVLASQTSTFRILGDLKLFLPKHYRKNVICYKVKGNPSIKDTIEALGIPHTEVDCIIVNGRSVGFFYKIEVNQKIVVSPDANKVLLKKVTRLKNKIPSNPKFILDSHLGKLAKYLRLLGFDTLYKNNYKDPEIVKIAVDTKRIVLTRDIGLLKNKAVKIGYFVREIEPKRQMKEVIKRFNLSKKIKPYKICLECNGKIKSVSKLKIREKLPPLTNKYYNKFYNCVSCKRIYWQGSHYKELSNCIKIANKVI